MPARSNSSRLLACLAVLTLAACATSPTTPTSLYSMPDDLGRARSPGSADPDSAAELAEAALYLLNPRRPGGPDYLGASRLCLLAIEVADPKLERDLRRACYRTAARSALRSGDRATYVEVVDRWSADAPRHERAAGELAVHRAIRSRLDRSFETARAPIPAELRRLLPAAEAGP